MYPIIEIDMLANLASLNSPFSPAFPERELLGGVLPSNEVWGDDWTIKFKPSTLVPGTLLLDPAVRSDFEFADSDFQHAVNRPALFATHEQYLELMKRIGAHTDKLVSVFAATAFPAHNEGTKFGARTVVVVTPEIVDTGRFKNHTELIPYFVFEHKQVMAETLPLLASGNLTRKDYQDVALRAKIEAMEVALYNGKLDEYLAFHDRVYKPKSKDPFVANNVELRLEAEKILEERYRSLGMSILVAILQKKPSASEKHEDWLKKQKRANYEAPGLPTRSVVYTQSQMSSG